MAAQHQYTRKRMNILTGLLLYFQGVFPKADTPDGVCLKSLALFNGKRSERGGPFQKKKIRKVIGWTFCLIFNTGQSDFLTRGARGDIWRAMLGGV